MYQQISLFDYDNDKYDFEKYVAITGSDFVDYEKRVFEEYKKHGCISSAWLKNEFGIGGWCVPVNNPKHVQSINYYKGNMIDIKYIDSLGAEREEKTNFKKVAKRLNELLKSGNFKCVNRSVADVLVMGDDKK